MKFLNKTLCATLAAIITVCTFASCSREQSQVSEIDLQNISLSEQQISDAQAKIEKELLEADFSGGAYVKLNKDIIYEKYFGYEDKQQSKSIDKSTLYQVSSLTKNITGAAILQLADAGKLSLDDTLDSYFDVSDGRAYLADVTIRKLVDLEVSFGAYNSELLKDDKPNPIVESYIQKGSGLKEYITNHILDVGIESGSNQAHSNYYLLGLIIEKASGESYKKYIQKNILDKAGMSETFVVNKDQKLSGYNVDKEVWRSHKGNIYYNNFEFMFSSFGVASTIGDLFKFYSAILSNELTQTNLIDTIDEFYTNYGFGFRRDGRNLYSYGGTHLHTSYAYINNETKELALLCSNHTGNIKLNATGKAVYNAVNAKINGMLLGD